MWGLHEPQMHVTGDVDGPVDAKWTMQKDFTMGEVVVKYKNQNFAFMQLKGNAEKHGMFPVMFDYFVKYNIHDAQEHQAKAKMKFDGKTAAKKFEMSFAPMTGTPMDLVWNMDFSFTMEKGDGEYKWVNSAQEFELTSKDTYIVSKQSPFYTMNTWVTRDREWTKMDHTRNFFDKVNMAHMTHKITHGTTVIQEGEMVFDIKTNDGPKFEMEHLHKMTMTEESPFYGMVFWWTGRYGQTERKMTVFFDKINKSILFVPKMSMNTVLTIDGEKVSEIVFDNTQDKKHFKFFWAPDAFTKDYLYTDEWEFPGQSGMKWTTDLKRGGVSVWNWVGDYSWINNANKFEFKTMDKVVQSPMSPFYGCDHFYVGKYYKNGERTRTVTYDKQIQNRRCFGQSWQLFHHSASERCHRQPKSSPQEQKH